MGRAASPTRHVACCLSRVSGNYRLLSNAIEREGRAPARPLSRERAPSVALSTRLLVHAALACCEELEKRLDFWNRLDFETDSLQCLRMVQAFAIEQTESVL